MNDNTTILEELKLISPVVAAIPSVNVYTVYNNYFSEAASEAMVCIAAQSLSKENSQQVPDGYFEQLSDIILAKIKNNETVFEETSAISSTIAAIGNINVYTVSEKYFDTLTFSNAPVAKVVSIFSKQRIVKYAVAAVITGLLGVGLFNTVQHNATLKMDEPTATAYKEANNIIKTNSFDKALESITDKDVENYLLQNGEDVNAAIIASTANEASTLPELEDYLNDENTLNNFLNDNNLKN